MSNLKDFATSLVAVAPTPDTSGTSLEVISTEGGLYPPTPFFATAHPATEPPTLANAEKIEVTDVTGDVLTIVRAQGDTVAQPIAVGWRISNTVFAADFNSGYGLADGPDYADPLYVYVGQENVNGSWKIYRRTVSTNVREYASGDSNYSTAWAGRAGLTYA